MIQLHYDEEISCKTPYPQAFSRGMPVNPEPALLLEPEDVRRLRAAGEPVVVLDARGSAAYARSPERVEGDVRVTSKDPLEWAGDLPRDAWLVAWCTCLNDGLAARVAERLRAAGFARAYAIRGGLAGCRAAGLKVVERPRPGL
jgi:rhodanese-related sulfurtransferase